MAFPISSSSTKIQSSTYSAQIGKVIYMKKYRKQSISFKFKMNIIQYTLKTACYRVFVYSSRSSVRQRVQGFFKHPPACLHTLVHHFGILGLPSYYLQTMAGFKIMNLCIHKRYWNKDDFYLLLQMFGLVWRIWIFQITSFRPLTGTKIQPTSGQLSKISIL